MNINDSLSNLFSFCFYIAFSPLSSFHLVLISDSYRCLLCISSGPWISIHIDNSAWVEEHSNWWASLQGDQDPQMSESVDYVS